MNKKYNNLENFETGKYVNIQTYKKNGKAVSTPVWFISKDNRIYFRTSTKSGKFKRIKNNNNVKFALCDFRGKRKGDWHNGLAKIDPDSNRLIFSKINEKYGIFAQVMNLFYKIKKMDIIILYIESRD